MGGPQDVLNNIDNRSRASEDRGICEVQEGIIYHQNMGSTTEIRYRRLSGILPWRVLHPQAVRGRWDERAGFEVLKHRFIAMLIYYI